MKISILRASSCLIGLAAAAAVGCSSQGCGGTDINATPTATQQSSVQCGKGTYLNSNYQCVPRPTGSSSANNTTSNTTPAASNGK